MRIYQRALIHDRQRLSKYTFPTPQRKAFDKTWQGAERQGGERLGVGWWKPSDEAYLYAIKNSQFDEKQLVMQRYKEKLIKTLV